MYLINKMQSRPQSRTSSFLETGSLQSQLTQLANVPVSFDFIEEYANERLLIKGQDRRKQVSFLDINDYPHDCLGAIICKNGSQRAMATGVLISSCLVLTSAHTFFSIDAMDKKKITTFKPQAFFVGLEGPLEEKKALGVAKYKINEEYKKIVEAIKEEYKMLD